MVAYTIYFTELFPTQMWFYITISNVSERTDTTQSNMAASSGHRGKWGPSFLMTLHEGAPPRNPRWRRSLEAAMLVLPYCTLPLVFPTKTNVNAT